jgi:hypothetical protein
MSYSEVPNTCKLKLHIPKDIINKNFLELGKKVEVAGVINCDDRDQVTHVDKQDGESHAVMTPNNVINFHTHPLNAYKEADCVWGWPSGEDIRESIKFSLAGNKAHLVFTCEGLYTIQVSPCKLKKIKERLNDQERGVLIFLIEEYFKSTHAFRSSDEVNDLYSNNIQINPYSFVDFANKFDIENLNIPRQSNIQIETVPISESGHTGIHSEENNNLNKYSGPNAGNEVFSRIPGHGFPDVEGNTIVSIPIKKYLNSLDKKEISEGLRFISKFGSERNGTSKNIVNIYDTILQKIGQKDCQTIWNNKKNPDSWFYVNFFPNNYYINKAFLKGRKFVSPNLNYLNLVNITTHEPFIRIFSNQDEGCSVKEIGKIHNFKPGTTKFTVSFGNGNSDLEYLKKI